ncbi:aquaporin isoform X3 [Arctopsyche grandis]
MTFAPLVVSTLFILLTSLLAHCARKLTTKLIKDPFVKILFEEAIAAAELCGCCFELIIIADNFGVATYAIFLFVLTIWWSLNWGDATACPYTHLEEYVEGKIDIRKMLLKTFAELTGGLLVFKYVQMYWALEISDTHKDRAFEDCKADLQVPMFYGAIVEGIATCICRLSSKSLGDLSPKFATAIDSFIGTSLVVAAFDYSGGYFNPVLATSLKYGCDGNTIIEHGVVYWVGACAGALLSIYLYKMPFVQKFIHGSSDTNGSIWDESKEE